MASNGSADGKNDERQNTIYLERRREDRERRLGFFPHLKHGEAGYSIG